MSDPLIMSAHHAKRILVASHSHPAVSKGGAELAALRLFQGIQAHTACQAFFLGCAREPGGGRSGSSITQPFAANDFLYAAGGYDWFKFANHDERFPRDFAELLERTRPDILHFHHYANFGVEAYLVAKKILPHCKIVLTLHEFQAICNHYGQMVTKQNRSLCYESTLRDCTKCFPEFSRSDFFLRRAYAMRFFDLVDLFIAPSQFLAERYVTWGVRADRMVVLENVVADSATPPLRDRPSGAIFQVGFFGQISLLKGIHVLLDAARILEDEDADDIVFNIHGDHTNQPPEFQEDFLTRLAKAGRNVRFHGAYDNHRVDSLMRGCDVVVLPSIWWENSPVVIQEARRNRVPIVCSNIGGMAEKVMAGTDGWHFNVGSAPDLAVLLRALAGTPERVAEMRASIRPPASSREGVAEHLDAYERLFQTGFSPAISVEG
jgi:glycosyltransferase involved in cell wall biosynthesis